MQFSKVVLALALLGSAASSRVPVEQLKEPENHFARTAEVKGWSATARADPTKQIRITVAVKQQNKDELNRVLYAVSTPGTAEYGHFLTNAEVNELVKPSADSVSHVMEWLNGATDIATSPNSDFVRATVTVAQAEALVGAEYWTYTHADTGKTIVRIGGNAEYSVPEEVAEHVDFVAPTLTFPALSSHTDASAKENLEKVQLGDDDYALISPPVLRAMYNLSESDRGAGDASTLKQGVASFLGEYYDMKDLESFREKYRVTLPNDLPTFTDVPEDQSHKPPGYEASLDVQWITTSGDQIVTEHWSTTGRAPDNPEDEPFVQWLTTLADDDEPPALFSISYGDEEIGVTSDYANRCSTEFQKAGARGISLIAASGDSGVGCSSSGFVATFPASCPYVTGVGGVTGGKPGSSPTGEFSWTGSGGGFSDIFTRPTYQQDAVSTYLNDNSIVKPASKYWNQYGAGFPDIAAQSFLFDECVNNFFYPISGTSAASPTATGILAMLTQARMDATGNTTALGWLNPTLYQIGADDIASGTGRTGRHAFNDVTDGVNTYCGDAAGFRAATGWDPVSGWGTLNYGKMKPVFEEL